MSGMTLEDRNAFRHVVALLDGAGMAEEADEVRRWGVRAKDLLDAFGDNPHGRPHIPLFREGAT